MVRNVIGSILALAGATAAVWSPFRAWYDGRHGSAYRVQDLFSGITDTRAELLGSILLPFAFAALVTLIGLFLRSRLLVAVAGLITLGFAILWMVRVAQIEDGLSVETDGTGLGSGAVLALGGGVLLLLASAVMSGRRRSRALRIEDHGPRSRDDAYEEPPRYPHEADEARWDRSHTGQREPEPWEGQDPQQTPWGRQPGQGGPYPDQGGYPEHGGHPDQGGPHRDQGGYPGQGGPYPDQGGHGPYPEEPPPPRQRP
ncbi:hypothetical protein [Streptomyces sp. NPDC053755]|uniref:hypothetical protein n=1 Tax=Streptomyces sp. NPDC053755 TaxID=3155815 RepID=UPI0034209FF0